VTERNVRMLVARDLWIKLGDVPTDGDECIEEPFRDFLPGTSVYEIWHWFEDQFGVDIAKDLMYPQGEQRDEIRD